MQEIKNNLTKSSLSQPKARLVELMQRMNFGSIEKLVVRKGELLFDPPPRVVREVKFCGENGPRPEVAKPDFTLKAQVRDLFAQIQAMGDGVIHSIEVKHGLPFKMIIEENVA